jgi:hypothetical protein
MRRVKLSYLFVLVSFAGLPEAFAQRVPFKNAPPPASDLRDANGAWIPPSEAELLRSNGSDLSLLHPAADTDLWSPGPKAQQSFPPLGSDLKFRFDSNLSSRSQVFRFTATQNSRDHGLQLHSFMISRNSFVVLLRARLLEKLGYQVPPIARLERMQMSFANAAERELFVSSLQGETFADPKRWVRESADLASNEIELQDVLVFEHVPAHYNLAMGRVPRPIIEGRRLLNSLNIAFEFVDVPESANLLSWEFGKTVSGSLVLGFEDAAEFIPNVDDARWMARRIVELSEQDLRDVAHGAHLPDAVAKLLFEKFKSRRNDLARDFSIQAKRFPVDFNVSHLPDLANGKLGREKWEGYGSRFSFGDPANPLSNSELVSLVKIKAFSNLLSNLVNLFNTEVLPSVDVNHEFQKQQLRRAQERFRDFVKTGQIQKVPFGAMVVPIAEGGVIASRDIVIGSYLGSENQVQLADSIGVFVRAGAAFGFEGLPTHTSVSGAATGSFVRTYSHLRPIQSMESVLKYPLKNLLVGVYASNTASILSPLSDGTFEALPEDQKRALVRQVFSLFDQNLGVGESLIVTDSLNGDLAVEGGYSSSEWAKIYARFESGQFVTSRVHILRYDASTIHVYRDQGTALRLQISAGVRAKITVLEVSGKFRSGKARTQFYRLPVAEEFYLTDSKLAVSQTRALMAVFQNSNFELLESVQTPFVLDFEFDEQQSRLQILPWRFGAFRTHFRVNVDHPNPAARERLFFRRQQSRLEGVNYEALVLDAVNAGISELGSDTFRVQSTSEGRPGDSIGGSSLVRSVVVDGELFDQDSRGRADLKDRYLNLSYQWRGWSASRSKINDILEIVRHKAPEVSPHEGAFQGLNSLHFYSIEYSLSVFEAGLRHAMSLSEAELADVFVRHGRDGANWGREWFLFRPLLQLRKLHLRNLNRRIVEYSSKDLADFVSLCELYLSLEGLAELFGGSDNVFASFRVTGFREGQEDGDRPYVSNTFGRFGTARAGGPLQAVKSDIKIADSEFFLNWLLERP